jgi:hypothetical protein
LDRTLAPVSASLRNIATLVLKQRCEVEVVKGLILDDGDYYYYYYYYYYYCYGDDDDDDDSDDIEDVDGTG